MKKIEVARFALMMAKFDNGDIGLVRNNLHKVLSALKRTLDWCENPEDLNREEVLAAIVVDILDALGVEETE